VRRALAVVAAGVLALGGARPARAQVAVYFQPLGDTAVGAVPGGTTAVEIRARDSLATTVLSANLTFHFDTTRIRILGVQIETGTGLDSIVDTTRGPGVFGVGAMGAAVGSDAALYRLLLQLKAGASSGTYVWIGADSAPSASGTLTAVGTISQVCHATNLWGDVSGDGQVDSRDALITLSNAVGLPVTGFNLALGDVDGDGLANSRDALLTLSYAIGLPLSGVADVRVASGVPDACPGLTAPGDSVVFLRNDAPAGLYQLGATSTLPVAVPGATNTIGNAAARLAADGRSLVYVCPGALGVQICKVDADTGGVVQLTDDSLATDDSPDWSPAGDSIVYLSNSTIMKMAANGSGQAAVISQTGPILATEVKWGRVRTKLAFSNGSLYVFDPTISSNPALVTTGFADIKSMRWSPAGDSIAFVRTTDPRLWVVPVSGGTPGIIYGFAGLITGGDWGSTGILISLDTGTGVSSIWLSRGIGQPIFRVTRPSVGDLSPTWRRSP